jgi:hypothetical protein
MALEVIALAVSTGALLVSIGALLWQSRQGERIGVSVISTVDQIYRRLEAGQGDGESLDVDWFAEVSARYVRRGQSVKLSVAGWPTGHRIGVPWEIRCVVEDGLTRRFQVVKSVEPDKINTSGSVECEAVFPDEFERASTKHPGRYHVWWRGREATEMSAHGASWYLLAQDSFGVLP